MVFKRFSTFESAQNIVGNKKKKVEKVKLKGISSCQVSQHYIAAHDYIYHTTRERGGTMINVIYSSLILSSAINHMVKRGSMKV